MLCGYPPFIGDSPEEIRNAIKNTRLVFPEREWHFISHDVKDLLQKMIKIKPKERINVLLALDHPWIQKLAPSIITLNPEMFQVLHRLQAF
jgi:calcium-dependent protein kinase